MRIIGQRDQSRDQWLYQLIEARDRLSDQLDIDQLTQNVLDHYDASTEENRRDGATWYPAARDWIRWAGQKYGYSPEKAAAVVASLSPQRFWSKKSEPQAYAAGDPAMEHQGTNLGDALRFFHHYTDYGPNELGMGALGSNQDRAARVHQAPDDFESISAALRNPVTGRVPPKITNFYHNFVGNGGVGDDNAVTIDSWMARGILGAGGNITDKPSAERMLNAPGSYDKMAEAVRRAAQARGLKPSEMQATVWTKLNNSHYTDPDKPSLSHPQELRVPLMPVIPGPGQRRRQPALVAAALDVLRQAALITERSRGGEDGARSYSAC